MKPISKPSLLLPNPSRRRFIEGLAAGGILLGLSPWIKTVQAKEKMQLAEVLTGTEFNLTIAETPVNFTGTQCMATTVNGSIPAPTLRWREGDTLTLRVTNHLAEETSIHWHGILPPYQMDGVPGISFKGIAPGETFTYRFKVQQSGTYWYHSHSGMQEQAGLYGAIIVDPAGADPIRADRDYVVLLSDWTDEDPMKIFSKLKKKSDYYNFNQLTAVDFLSDAADDGVASAIQKRHMWNMMNMNMTDLSDISAYTYTYLMNGTTPGGNWTGLFRPGERVRLRFINSGAMTFFDVRIPGLKMTVVQADGQNVEPISVDEFRIGSAETYDVIVTPEAGAYTIFAQSMDRTGYARGTLATHAGMTAAVPTPDKPEPLTMEDMMGNMGSAGKAGMNHGDMAMDHSAHAMGGGQVPVRHASTEYGPSVDMRVDTPRTNLDDPGIGLRNNRRRVLTYADLHTIGGSLDLRKPGREIELHLTGNMERYSWSLDGLEFGKSTPVHFPYGERLRVILVNDTMMTHPMHLHGMWMELESPDGDFQVRKHTLSVQPAQRVTFLVTPDGLGRWAWHCHLSYHMHAGMMREVVVA
ncbi:copper resistance system multicopper oxidase [Methylobacter sp. BBA5.1]|jgi:CopA family copper-resistance protein|uniref:copper resistance system multicopper oxidase n=1 Tax=Methylobacter sp. BBA5.1 TaxID=1495064 RepID=UPI0005685971|nr:copper resistance system multicopper oxidase [Methylobacter sp. BBA5.1]